MDRFIATTYPCVHLTQAVLGTLCVRPTHDDRLSRRCPALPLSHPRRYSPGCLYYTCLTSKGLASPLGVTDGTFLKANPLAVEVEVEVGVDIQVQGTGHNR